MSKPPRPDIDSYGFEWPKDFNHEQYDEFMSKYIKVLTNRAKRWEKLLSSKEDFEKTNKVKRFVRKGIPGSHRAEVWSLISGAKEMRDQNPDLYFKLLNGPMKQEVVETIDLDIPRTFPDNIYFKTASTDSKLEPLKRVLLAFAHQNPSIGYCQGLNFIAGIMLLVTENEDMTFWLLQGLQDRILPDYYTKEMTGLLTDIGVLEELIKTKAPRVHNHMLETGVSWSMYVSKWFICLFAEVLPIETVLRIWDCLFSEGSKVLLRVAVTLVFQNQDKILAAKNFVEITEVFKGLPLSATVTECHTFMKAIFKVPKSFSKVTIQKLRETCRDKVVKEQEHTKVLQEQQKKKQIEEQKAREAALKLKREQEEKEAAIKAEQERLDAEKAEQERLEAKEETTGSEDQGNVEICEAAENVNERNDFIELKPSPVHDQKSINATNQNISPTVIESLSTESIKQVANGQQITSRSPEAGTSETTPQV